MEKIITGFNKKDICILVTDDESFVLKLDIRILDKLGYDNVNTSEDGNAALGCIPSALVGHNPLFA